MLKLLSITNLAVVSRVTIEFGDGLNLLTGETGSGKSIVVDALGLVAGARATADMIRTGETTAYVEAVFQIDDNNGLRLVAEASGITLDDDELIVRRELSDRGRTRVFVNDRLATVNLLRAFRPFLLDIHGQGDQQSLLNPESHLWLLDEFGELQALRSEVRELYDTFSQVKHELSEMRRSEAERLRSLDMLDFQIAEIETAGLQLGEHENLIIEHKIQANAEKLTQLASEAYELLYEGEGSALGSLNAVDRRVEGLSELDARFAEYLETMRNARYGLEDLAYFLRDYASNIEFSVDRLSSVEQRISEIERLGRKYGGSPENVLHSLEEMKSQRERLGDSEETIRRLEEEAVLLHNRYLSLAQELSGLRRRAATSLEDLVSSELQELAMGETSFRAVFNESPNGDAPAHRDGIDQVEFYVSTNIGEEMRPLARIASGGEISRLMLALKTVSAPPEIPRTLIFDEVDVGIGGRVAESVGQRLAGLSRSNQIICVTHQAQVARFADSHFTVRKSVMGERTETEVVRLNGKNRVEELARMIGGADITETTRKHARELLAQRQG